MSIMCCDRHRREWFCLCMHWKQNGHLELARDSHKNAEWNGTPTTTTNFSNDYGIVINTYFARLSFSSIYFFHLQFSFVSSLHLFFACEFYCFCLILWYTWVLNWHQTQSALHAPRSHRNRRSPCQEIIHFHRKELCDIVMEQETEIETGGKREREKKRLFFA